MEPHYSLLVCLLSATLLCFNVNPSSAVIAHQPRNAARVFIRAQCNATKFPQLCYNSLSLYAPIVNNSPVELAHAALSVSVHSAQSTSTMITRLSSGGRLTRRESEAMSDCIETLSDSVDALNQSVQEMRELTGKNTKENINDIQTWVSTALTDENTCMEGFSGNAMNVGVKKMVRGRVVDVAKLTSNALSLVSAIAAIGSPSP